MKSFELLIQSAEDVALGFSPLVDFPASGREGRRTPKTYTYADLEATTGLWRSTKFVCFRESALLSSAKKLAPVNPSRWTWLGSATNIAYVLSSTISSITRPTAQLHALYWRCFIAGSKPQPCSCTQGSHLIILFLLNGTCSTAQHITHSVQLGVALFATPVRRSTSLLIAAKDTAERIALPIAQHLSHIYYTKPTPLREGQTDPNTRPCTPPPLRPHTHMRSPPLSAPCVHLRPPVRACVRPAQSASP